MPQIPKTNSKNHLSVSSNPMFDAMSFYLSSAAAATPDLSASFCPVERFTTDRHGTTWGNVVPSTLNLKFVWEFIINLPITFEQRNCFEKLGLQEQQLHLNTVCSGASAPMKHIQYTRIKPINTLLYHLLAKNTPLISLHLASRAVSLPSRVRPWNVVHARSRTVGAISHPVRGPAPDRHSFVSRASVLYGSAHGSLHRDLLGIFAVLIVTYWRGIGGWSALRMNGWEKGFFKLDFIITIDCHLIILISNVPALVFVTDKTLT